MSTSGILAIAAVCVFGAGHAATGEQPLTVSVSPLVAPAPGFVRVSARVAPSEENRVLEVSASSSEFGRSSEIQLDGIRAPRLSVVDYRDLPAGVYEISAVLIGSQGKRATVSRFVQILPTPGQR